MIRLSKSIIGPQEMEAVQVVMKRGYLSMAQEVQSLESEIRAYLEADVNVTCINTGTSALHLAAQGLGLGPGDEVLIPTLTFVASFQAVSATGATPIACDVRLEDGLLDLNDAERRLTPRTKAIMAVHYASAVGDYDGLYAFARAHKLRVIEDAAHSFGCRYKGKKIGAIGDVVCFSFDGIKNITCGEGGAIVTSDAEVTRRVSDARLLGVMNDTEKRFAGQRSWDFDVSDQGWRYHMSDLMAAIGRVQLKRFEPEFKPKRMQLTARYRKRLGDNKGVALFSQGGAEAEIVPHILPIRVLGGKRDSVRQKILDAQIQVGLHYKPSHLLTKFRRPGPPLPVAERIYPELLTLPLHPEVSEADVDRILDILESAL